MSTVAIIGGGPAGLALAYRLDQTNIQYTLFEANSIGSTWAAVPPELRVLSPWWTDALRWRDVLRGNPFHKPSAGQYLTYLQRIRHMLRGTILEESAIKRLQPKAGRWQVETERGHTHQFDCVVLATGYFSSPRMGHPSITHDRSIPILHAAEIRDYSQLGDYSTNDLPVLVIGRRVTAGQLLLELDQRGISTALSIRSPLSFRRSGISSRIREALYFVWEEVQARLSPGIRRDSYPVMDGGRTQFLIDSGRVPVYGTVVDIKNGNVRFSDNRSSRFSAIIFATGYNPTLELLDSIAPVHANGLPDTSEFTVTNTNGLYLLGFDNIYDHRSRYLRGIRADARRLSRLLAEANALTASPAIAPAIDPRSHAQPQVQENEAAAKEDR